MFPLTDVKAYMGHASIETTMRYAHHVPKVDAAKRFTEAIEQAKGEDQYAHATGGPGMIAQ